jgi:hypothetical protein
MVYLSFDHKKKRRQYKGLEYQFIAGINISNTYPGMIIQTN